LLMEKKIGLTEGAVCAKRPIRLPVVLTKEERMRAGLLSRICGLFLAPAKLQAYGTGRFRQLGMCETRTIFW
jgi:hypothetical protein